MDILLLKIIFWFLKSRYPDIDFEYFQSNIEGEIINEIQKSGFSSDGIILNAGGYTHTSVAITDAIAAVKTPVIEVHITNISATGGIPAYQSYRKKLCRKYIRIWT